MFLRKLSFLKISAFALLVYSPQLFAAEIKGNADTNTQRDLTSDEIDQVKQLLYNQPLKPYSINVYGLLQANFNFVDTARNNTPDFSVSHARLGVLAVEQNWSGKLEVEFVGNQPRALFPKGATPTYLTQSGNNTVTVRQAQINYDFYKYTSAPYGQSGVEKRSGEPTTAPAVTDAPQSYSDTYISRLAIGGIRVGGAAATAPDSANTPSGYGRQDGIYLIENMAFGKQTTANLGFGVFNTLNTTNAGRSGSFQGWGINAGTSPNFLGVFGINSSTFSKAFLFNGGFTRNFTPTSYFSAVGYYGFQNDAAVNTNENGFATTVRNATHVEASLLYNDTKLFGQNALLSGNGLVFYFEDESGSNQRKTSAFPIDFLDAPALNDGYNHTLYGLSLGGDTAGYFTGIFKNADRFLYSGSITFVDARFRDHNFSNNYTVTEFAGALGYGYKSLEMEITAAYSTSPQKSIANFNVNSPTTTRSTENNNFIAYFTAALYF